jgi:hypothetical protein
MTQKFVRYSPDVEQMEPDFEQSLQTVLDAMKHHMRGSLQAEGIGRLVRDAHAKGYGSRQGRGRNTFGITRTLRTGHLHQTGTPRSHGSLFEWH